MLDEAFEVLREIQARGGHAVIVGGAVRDFLLGRPLTDVDLATDMAPDELSSLFKTYAVGRSRQFDTVVITRGGHSFEISRFRRGMRAPGGSGAAALPAPGLDTLREDTAHRDFTINALVMRADGEIVDLQGGLADLRDRVVRCVGVPEDRFTEDPVRVLRAVRFAACLGFTIEGGTAEAIARAAPLLAAVVHERIGKEIVKIAAQPGSALAAAVALMDRFGLLEQVLPEVADLRGLPQPAAWHPEGDVWEHTLAALRSSTSDDPAVNLAVLLHDVGKRPAHREVAGRHRYHGHERAGCGVVEDLSRRLCLPQRLRAAVAFAVEHHLQAVRLAEMRRSKVLALLTSGFWPVLRAVALCDLAARGNDAAVPRLEAVFRDAEADAAATGRPRTGAPPITGARVMEVTGLAPGPLVGEILRSVRAWAQDNRIEDQGLIAAEIARAARRPPPK